MKFCHHLHRQHIKEDPNDEEASESSEAEEEEVKTKKQPEPQPKTKVVLERKEMKESSKGM